MEMGTLLNISDKLKKKNSRVNDQSCNFLYPVC